MTWSQKSGGILKQFEQRFTELIGMDFLELREIPEAVQNTRSLKFLKSCLNPKGYQGFARVTTDSRMQQQIIPNVNKIKIEKQRAIRRYQQKNQLIENNRRKKKKSTTNLLEFTIDSEASDLSLKKRGSTICPWSYYMENLFSKDDLFLYRSVMNFYAGRYREAISDMRQSYDIKKNYKVIDNDIEQRASFNSADLLSKDFFEDYDNKEDEAYDPLNPHLRQHSVDSQESDKTDLSDVGLCSLNKNEMKFNVILCLVKMLKYKKAHKLLVSLKRTCPHKYVRDLVRLEDILTSWLVHQQKLASGEKPKRGERQTLTIQPFPLSSRLCRFYPSVLFQFGNED